MAYQQLIGLRYLFGNQINRRMLTFAGAALVLTLVGVGLVVTADDVSPVGVILLLLGTIATTVFGMMSIFSVFTSVSVLGVALGVAALTVVLAVTTGFQAQFREKVLGVNAHVIVLKQQSTFAEYREVMAKALVVDPDVLAAQPFIFAEMLVTRGQGQLSGVAIKGIDPALIRAVLDLDKHLLDGATVDSLAAPLAPGQAPPIIMGRELARKLRAKVGDDVTVVVPLSNIDFDSQTTIASGPRTRVFRVTGIFYSGFDEYDRRLMYAALKDLQELVGRGDQVMGVEIKVKDVDRAEGIARKLEAELGGLPYQVQDWYELNKNLFTALEIQKRMLVLILTIIIAVAAFNMVSALIMLVTEKTKEVAILRSMGATKFSIFAIFQIVGLAITAVGIAAGVSIGLVTCHVTAAYGYRLDPKVYLIDRLPIVVRPVEVLIVVIVTIVIGMLATVIPSLIASWQRPSDGLRYD